MKRTLVIGFGNPGRGDDGLGPALAERLEAMGRPGLDVESDYQLVVEHAEAVAHHDLVIFTDAHVACREPFEWRRIQAADLRLDFSSHSLTPEAVLALARDLFGAEPEAYAMAIRGYRFDEFREGLSPEAERNLAAALEFLRSRL